MTRTKDLTFVSLKLGGEGKEVETEKVFEEIMAGKFPNLAKDTNLWVQEPERTSNRMNNNNKKNPCQNIL